MTVIKNLGRYSGHPAPTRRSVGEATCQAVIGAEETLLLVESAPLTPVQALSARGYAAIPRKTLAADQLRELPPDSLHLGVKAAHLQK
jgi:hypothetical protein